MNILIGIILWAPVIVVKVIAVFVGLLAVPLGIGTDWPLFLRLWWDRHPVPTWWYGRVQTENKFARRFPEFWWRAIRNPVGGFGYLIEHPYYRIRGEKIPDYRELGRLFEATKTDARFQWRIRHHRFLVSFRCLWRYNRKRYGEIYIGWKLGSAPPQLDFALSLRPYARVGQ